MSDGRCLYRMPLHTGCRLDCGLPAGHEGLHRDTGYPIAWSDVADVEIQRQP